MEKQKRQVQVQQDAAYEAFIARLKELFQKLDEYRWEVGRMLSGAEKQYGEDAFGKIAGDLRVSKQTVYDYARVFKTFNGMASVERFQAGKTKLTWTHFLLASKAGDPDSWIGVAESAGLSSSELRAAIKQAEGPKEREPEDYRVRILRNDEGDKTFEVLKVHVVHFKKGEWSCDCEAWWYHKEKDCKHLLAVKDELKRRGKP